jgi:hypothetical protein
MSSPFDVGRDSNVGPGHAFGEEPEVADGDVGAFNASALAEHPNRLGESDYRS